MPPGTFTVSIYEKKLDTLIESHHPAAWSDIRRFVEHRILIECQHTYRQNGWEPPQNNDFSGVRHKALTLLLKDDAKLLKDQIPPETAWTDQHICNMAHENYIDTVLITDNDTLYKDRRHLRRQARQATARWLYENKAIKNYTSDYSVNLTADMDTRNKSFLQNRYIKTETGEISLYDIAQKSLSNIHNENIAICRDMIKLAKRRQWFPHFITLTCAGYRRQFTPDINHNFIQKQWSRMRAYLNKIDIKAGTDFIGMRCEEPHKDGTPHRHLVLFTDNETWDSIRQAFLTYFLDADRPKETGAARARVKFDTPGDDDWEKAASYCMKYTFKSTTDTDVSKFPDSKLTAIRCRAWRQDWGIRAFQFFGCGTKTLFRYCRNRNFDSDTALPIVRAAQAGDWLNFMIEFQKIKPCIRTLRGEIHDAITGNLKKLIGYGFKNTGTIITHKINYTTIHRKTRNTTTTSEWNELVTVILTAPRESKPNPQTPKPEPPPCASLQ